VPATSRDSAAKETATRVRRRSLIASVPEAADRGEQLRRGRVLLDLVAQPVDQVVDDPAVTGVAVAPDLAQQVVPAQHPSLRADQLGQDVELDPGHRDRLPVTQDLRRVRMQLDGSAHEDLAAVLLLGRHGTPDLGADAGHELFGHERLGDVVVGAGLEPGHDVVAVGLGGDDDDRDLARRAEAANEVEAVDPGEAQVHQDDVDLLVHHQHQALLGRHGLEDPVPLVLEVGAQHQADRIVVLDDHHSTDHAPIQPRFARCHAPGRH
jgi:hypothetical protein